MYLLCFWSPVLSGVLQEAGHCTLILHSLAVQRPNWQILHNATFMNGSDMCNFWVWLFVCVWGGGHVGPLEAMLEDGSSIL